MSAVRHTEDMRAQQTSAKHTVQAALTEQLQ